MAIVTDAGRLLGTILRGMTLGILVITAIMVPIIVLGVVISIIIVLWAIMVGMFHTYTIRADLVFRVPLVPSIIGRASPTIAPLIIIREAFPLEVPRLVVIAAPVREAARLAVHVVVVP